MVLGTPALDAAAYSWYHRTCLLHQTTEDVGDVGRPDNEPDGHGSAHSDRYSENNAGTTTDTIGPTVAESLETKDEGAPVK